MLRDYTILSPALDDIRSLTALWSESWRETYPNEAAGVSRDWVEQRTAKWLREENLAKRRQKLDDDKNNPAILRRIAKDQTGKVVGLLRAERNEGRQYLHALYIHKRYYGSGLAQKLMEELLSWADIKRPIELEVATYNERAKAFYRKLAFNEVPGTKKLFADKIPVIQMIRKGDNS